MNLKSVLILLVAFSFYACNQTDGAKDRIPDSTIIESHNEHTADRHDEHTAALSLNNGEKWQTDKNTRIHAAALIAKTESFNQIENANADDYQAFSIEMQKELNSLVSDCKMEGAGHDALHLWLQTVLQEVKRMKNISTVEEGKKDLHKLTENVQKFNQYFN